MSDNDLDQSTFSVHSFLKVLHFQNELLLRRIRVLDACLCAKYSALGTLFPSVAGALNDQSLYVNPSMQRQFGTVRQLFCHNKVENLVFILIFTSCCPLV